MRKLLSLGILALFVYVVAGELLGFGLKAKRKEFAPIPFEQSKKIYTEFGGAAEHPPVTMFVTAWCGVCRALEKDLDAAGVKYVRADIEEDRNAFLYYQSVTQGKTRGVPVTLVGSTVFLGHKLEKILNELRNATI